MIGMEMNRLNRVRSLTQPCWVLACLLAAFTWKSGAEPLVPGYERFHSEIPSIEGGAILYSELGCANCHDESPVLTKRQGPTLAGLAQRVDRDWVSKFLREPETGREGSPMPQMFHGLQEGDVEAVVAYLGTLGPEPKLRPAKYVNAERGSALYHEKGCVACHEPSAGSDVVENGGATPWAVPHPDFREKTSFDALTLFLSAPSKIRTDGRMPHFTLDSYEVGDIAAHLYDFQGSDPGELKGVAKWPAPDEAGVERGRELVESLNCAACHTIEKTKPAPVVKLDGKADRICYSVEAHAGLPHYALNEGQRASLDLFLANPESPDKTQTTLAAMNCFACHSRDGVGGPGPETAPFFHGDEALADSGRFPPPLTGIGHKLERDWMEGVLSGKEGSRVRPYLKTQMPNYPAHARLLADWFEKVDAKPDAQPIAHKGADTEAGRKLLGTVGGVNCITCHQWDERPSLGIQALDLASLNGRLRPEWLRSYLLNPSEYRPGTLMPPLWPGGHSTVPDVLGGDTEKQIASIWKFISEGEGAPDGFPEHGSSEFDLVPTDRPIVMRTFLEGAGTKAILVGFPVGIHLAIDGNSGQPALAWRGPFFNAYQTWYSRQAPIEKPLSEEIYAFPKGQGESRFLGYLLDENGNPTFLTQRDGREISDKFEILNGALVRTVTWENGTAPQVVHPEGADVESAEGEKSLTLTYSWK